MEQIIDTKNLIIKLTLSAKRRHPKKKQTNKKPYKKLYAMTDALTQAEAGKSLVSLRPAWYK